jgi:hypothetical protein
MLLNMQQKGHGFWDRGMGHILLMTEQPCFGKLSAALGLEVLEHLL